MAARDQLTIIEILKRGGVDLFKGCAAALASLVGLILGDVVAGWIHLPSPTIPAYMSTAILMPLMMISEISIAIVLGEYFQWLNRLSSRLTGSPWGCASRMHSSFW